MAAPAHPIRLYLFQLGTMSLPIVNATLELSSGCYLVQMSDGTNILIDSGLPAGYIHTKGSPVTPNTTNVIDQLASILLTPDDIDLVICSHFDIDHAGYHDAFPSAEFVVQREHYELAKGGTYPRFEIVRDHWDHPALRYHLVDGDTELLPGITLLKTPGHVPAHQSVLLTLPQTGKVLLAMDAVVMERLFTPKRHAWASDDNEADLRASTQKLLDIVEQQQVKLVIFHHDGLQWQTLKKAPEYYG